MVGEGWHLASFLCVAPQMKPHPEQEKRNTDTQVLAHGLTDVGAVGLMRINFLPLCSRAPYSHLPGK